LRLLRRTGLRAMLLMLLSTLFLSTMHGLVRYVSSDMHPFEIAFFRNLFGLAAILPLVWRAGPGRLATRQPHLQLIRGALGVVAMLGWFYGLSVVPIAEATALSFSSALFGSLGAVILLGEKMRLRRWSAIIIGFIGTLVILRPGVEALDAGSLIIVLSAFCWGTNVVIVKRLGQTDSAVSVVAWMSIVLTVMSIFPALWVWQWPSAQQLGWLLLIGTVGTCGHLCMVNALKLADATSILPLDFTRLLWTSLIGFWVFSEIPDIWTWIGGIIIFSSSAFITYREANLKKKVNP
jgi:drug/metabolite transporter (DMT)-like permease